jgi:hypothetical protein
MEPFFAPFAWQWHARIRIVHDSKSFACVWFIFGVFSGRIRLLALCSHSLYSTSLLSL